MLVLVAIFFKARICGYILLIFRSSTILYWATDMLYRSIQTGPLVLRNCRRVGISIALISTPIPLIASLMALWTAKIASSLCLIPRVVPLKPIIRSLAISGNGIEVLVFVDWMCECHCDSKSILFWDNFLWNLNRYLPLSVSISW